MTEEAREADYYEVLQVNPTAELETIHRVYRLLAQRFHPDNQQTGDANRFRVIHEAYATLADPERRARYDAIYHQQRQDRWRLIATGQTAEEDFELEQVTRLTLLEALQTKRRVDAAASGTSTIELEELLGRPREHLEYTIWYLAQKKLILRDDSARLLITADGVDFLEQNYRANSQRRRLQSAHQAE